MIHPFVKNQKPNSRVLHFSSTTSDALDAGHIAKFLLSFGRTAILLTKNLRKTI
jgi:hypothetical protein